jgi:Protein of unknown function (DUF4019)
MFIRSLLAVLLISAGPALAQSAPAPKPSMVVGPAKKSTITASTPAPDDRARQWLVLVDDKNYAQSWTESGKAFQSRQKTDAWAKDATDRRAPLGAVASRNLKTIDLSRSNTAVVRYDTAFAHKASAVETVTLSFENGSWSVTDYTVD